MLFDLTLQITPDMMKTAGESEKKVFSGHMGTHFDVMDKEFPLEYTRLPAVVFDVSHVQQRDIEPADIDLEQVKQGMFVVFYTGYIHQVEYGTVQYFKEHPQLSQGLIDALLDKGVFIIGIDCAGIRRGKEHVPADQRCADRGVFVVENLTDLARVLASGGQFTAETYPVRYTGMTGLPCRVIARV